MFSKSAPTWHGTRYRLLGRRHLTLSDISDNFNYNTRLLGNILKILGVIKQVHTDTQIEDVFHGGEVRTFSINFCTHPVYTTIGAYGVTLYVGTYVVDGIEFVRDIHKVLVTQYRDRSVDDSKQILAIHNLLLSKLTEDQLLPNLKYILQALNISGINIDLLDYVRIKDGKLALKEYKDSCDHCESMACLGDIREGNRPITPFNLHMEEMTLKPEDFHIPLTTLAHEDKVNYKHNQVMLLQHTSARFKSNIAKIAERMKKFGITINHKVYKDIDLINTSQRFTGTYTAAFNGMSIEIEVMLLRYVISEVDFLNRDRVDTDYIKFIGVKGSIVRNCGKLDDKNTPFVKDFLQNLFEQDISVDRLVSVTDTLCEILGCDKPTTIEEKLYSEAIESGNLLENNILHNRNVSVENFNSMYENIDSFIIKSRVFYHNPKSFLKNWINLHPKLNVHGSGIDSFKFCTDSEEEYVNISMIINDRCIDTTIGPQLGLEDDRYTISSFRLAILSQGSKVFKRINHDTPLYGVIKGILSGTSKDVRRDLINLRAMIILFDSAYSGNQQ